MEIFYAPSELNRRKFSLLGMTSVGVSAVLICLPVAAILISNFVIANINSRGMMRRLGDAGLSLSEFFNGALVTLSAAGMLISLAGVITSRRRCLASMSAALFNLAMILNAAMQGA